MEKISVIIPCFNSSSTILRCVDSVISSDYHPIEIIMVDDCSTDNTLSVLETIKGRNEEFISVLASPQNRGAASARNMGAKLATGKYFFFLDSDTEMLPGTLNQFITTIRGADSVCGHYHWRPLNNTLTAWYKALLNYSMNRTDGIFKYEVFNSAVAGIDERVFLASGGFNESLGRGMDYENEEFGHRLFRQYETLFDPDLLVRHEFPNFRKLTMTYFWRVSLWMELFCRRREFEKGGLGARSTGLATVSLTGALLTWGLSFSFPHAILLTIVFFFMYIKGYWPFYWFVCKTRAKLLPIAILFNCYFCVTITLGAMYGMLKVFTSTGHVDGSQEA